MVNPQMVMYEEEFNQIQNVVDRLVKDANAKVVFIVDKNGQLIAASGDVDNLDTTSLASLTAGNIAATGGMAKLLKENEFATQFHEGEKANIHIQLVGNRVILVVIFDSRSSLVRSPRWCRRGHAVRWPPGPPRGPGRHRRRCRVFQAVAASFCWRCTTAGWRTGSRSPKRWWTAGIASLWFQTSMKRHSLQRSAICRGCGWRAVSARTCRARPSARWRLSACACRNWRARNRRTNCGGAGGSMACRCRGTSAASKS